MEKISKVNVNTLKYVLLQNAFFESFFLSRLSRVGPRLNVDLTITGQFKVPVKIGASYILHSNDDGSGLDIGL